MWFQHDDASGHNDRRVRETLNNMFSGRWIGRGRRISFPRFPDFMFLHFFSCGVL